MLVKMVCPQCGAPLEMDSAREFMFCMHCGTKVMNVAQRYEVNQNVQVNGTVLHRYDNTGQPNLHINFVSTNPAVGMVTRFVYSNQKNYFISGQNFSFHLPYGEQQIILKIGKKNYARTVFLPQNNVPVTIYASWNGRAHINIDQPPYTPPAPQPVAYRPIPAPVQTATKQCPKCGSVIGAQLQFCTQCGNRFEAPAVCAGCGRTLNPGENFCPGCGTKK